MTPTPTPTDPTNPAGSTAIVTPVMALLRSRKALTALAGVVINVVIALLPSDIAPRFEAIRGDLITMVTILFGLVIGGIAIEDTKVVTPPGGSTLKETREETVGTPVVPPTSAEQSGQG